MKSTPFSLIAKELLLVFHPMTLVVLCLSALVLVPNWPYAVILLYACLCPYFNAQNAREQRDLDFSQTLPISRQNIVFGRIGATILVEIVCIALMFIFSLIRPFTGSPNSFIGMPPNLAFLGFALLTFTVFDALFFIFHYRNPSKLGLPFITASVPTLFVMIAFEAAPYFSSDFAHLFAQPGFANFEAQIAILLSSAIIFAIGHLATIKIAGKNFEKIDI